jgi:CRISPR-associated protein Csb1
LPFQNPTASDTTTATEALLDISTLKELVKHSVALRSLVQLRPAGGDNDKIFPPTYAGGDYATEIRRIDGEAVDCVLLDSVQSQANRFESALQDALDRELIAMPCIRVSFPAELARELGPITSLTVPHRCYDAILRDSMEANTPFPKTAVGSALAAARSTDATALYRHCPTVLVFGGWDSTGARGGMGAKFTRAVSSEIVGIGATVGVRTSSRIDPLGIRREVGVLIEGNDRARWRVATAGDKGAKRPSEIVHGNIAPTIADGAGGVTVDRIEQTWVLSLSALRRYRFPLEGVYEEERDVAARLVLTALALVARALARDDGFFLRSRCQLAPASGTRSRLEVIAPDGSMQEIEDPTVAHALELLVGAVDAAAARGLEWVTRAVELQPEERLIELVRRSFELTSNNAE